MPTIKKKPAIATESKIPKAVKEIGGTAVSRYVVYHPSIIKAAAVATMLTNAEKKKEKVPFSGYVTIKREKIYYILYGFVDRLEFYE